MRYPKWNEKLVQRYIKEGRGLGEGADYVPWHHVRDFSSRGYSREVKGLKVPREHQLLSKTEWQFFLHAEWSRQVVDIREQYPLDRDYTQSIAQKLGVPHYCYDETHEPVVMTVDFYLTIEGPDGPTHLAVDIKDTTGAESAAAVESLEIHRTYFAQRDTPHKLVFPSSMDATVIANLQSLRAKLLRDNEKPESRTAIEDHFEVLAAWLHELRPRDRVRPVDELCQEFDKLYRLEPGCGLRILGILLYERVFPVNLHSPAFFQASLEELLTPRGSSATALLRDAA